MEKIDYFEAAASLSLNWDHIVASGHFNKEQLRYLADVKERPGVYQSTSRAVDDYLESIQTGKASVDLLRALLVIVLDRNTRAYLESNDPQALKQAEAAIQKAGSGHRLEAAKNFKP